MGFTVGRAGSLLALGLLIAAGVVATAAADPPAAQPDRKRFNPKIETLTTPTPRPGATATPTPGPQFLPAFDVLLTVDNAALAASKTTLANLCARITVSVSFDTGLRVIDGGPVFSTPQKIAPSALAGTPNVCDARYSHVRTTATLMIAASYVGTGAPFSIGPSSPNFYENPTVLARHETPSSLTGNVYRGMSVAPVGEPVAHPTVPHHAS